ncbi:uncharacterized protein LOC110722714 [Chenopodium quinoa]|uniref:Uncharacterized protein n=1 Tax=Chenopodium quinoa TaxID=63459 RepID=A0A803LWL0_CHEQI|nr:uncharacterized protein LOC110722714 [Chenopodium quinoa]
MKAVATSTPSPSLFFCHHPFNNSSPQFLHLKSPHQQQRLGLFITLSSSTSSSSVVEQQDSPLPSTNDSDSLPSNFSGCKGCGKEEIESGCNGEGRIQGGIATIPGFGWWPIKAYRPCPGFLASGGNYRRRGQSMDEVAFGGGKRQASMDDFDDSESKKKGKNRKQFKG